MISAPATEIENGKTLTCTAYITPDTATRQIVRWSSSNENLATVNSLGVVTAASVETGNVVITATATESGLAFVADLTYSIRQSRMEHKSS